MALRLRQLGLLNAFALTGGFGAWEEARYPVEPLIRGDPRRNAELHQPM